MILFISPFRNDESEGWNIVKELGSDWTSYVLFAGPVYIIFLVYVFAAKIDDSRKKLIAPLFALSIMFPIVLLDYKYKLVISLVSATLIILIGWLYPSRKEDQT